MQHKDIATSVLYLFVFFFLALCFLSAKYWNNHHPSDIQRSVKKIQCFLSSTKMVNFCIQYVEESNQPEWKLLSRRFSSFNVESKVFNMIKIILLRNFSSFPISCPDFRGSAVVPSTSNLRNQTKWGLFK